MGGSTGRLEGVRIGFALLCPDLVVELAGPSDEGAQGITSLRHKMDCYQANAARLGWLLLPGERAVEAWPAKRGTPRRIEQAELPAGGADFPGLQFDLGEIWAG